MQRPIDVAILVLPVSPDSARVIVNYSKLVPHEQVTKEIGRLEVKGWQVAKDLRLEDRSINPSDLQHHPKTTGASFTLLSAPQVQEGAPALWNYIQAFQAWNHLEIMFNLPTLPAESGPSGFDSASYSVQRIPDAGLFHYDVTIIDHTGPLSALPTSATKTGTQTIPTGEDTRRNSSNSSSLLPLMLLLLGTGLLVGGGLYLFLAKKSSNSRSARTLR